MSCNLKLLYVLVFVLTYDFIFGLIWLRSEMRQSDYFRPNLRSSSLSEISIVSGLAAAYIVFRVARNKD